MSKQRTKPSAYWKPGQPLTERDRVILQPILDKAAELGRTPTKREVSGTDRVKLRFHTWDMAINAAGLPPLRDAEQDNMRISERMGKKKTS